MDWVRPRQLLSQTSDLRILATSREPLAVAGEMVYPLGGLSTPTGDRIDYDLSRLLGYDAVRLFVERAGSISDFIETLRSGRTPDGRFLSDDMPWKYYGQMTDDELKALWLYLHSQPALGQGG